ncbi:uncharacterized protein RJT20DRAFT_2465 [Scheffersomyces xylosifermentans]|uniref:uncharacterized protein n=1 Tax=Scheffersomyces xylosifermentans TaxID=1304137 RepID=UPI00315C7846
MSPKSIQLCDLPSEILQQVVNRLSPDVLKFLISTKTYVSSFATNAYYNSILITKYHKGNDSSFEIGDEEEQLMRFQFWNNRPREDTKSLVGHQTKINGTNHFREFAEKYSRLHPSTLIICDLEDFKRLHTSVPDMLRRANKIVLSLCWSDINNLETLESRIKLLNRIISLPYNFHRVILSIFNYSHLPIDYSTLAFPPKLTSLSIQEKSHDESVRGNLGNKLLFFKSVAEFSELSFNNIRLQLEDLKLLPRNLRRLQMNLSLVFSDDAYTKLDLPSSLKELDIVACSFDTDRATTHSAIDISNLLQLERLTFAGGILEDLRSFVLPHNLVHLELSNCNNFRYLYGLELASKLKTLSIQDCSYFLYIHTITSFNKFPPGLQSLILESRRRIYPGRHLECIREFAEDVITEGRRSYLVLGRKCQLPPNLQELELTSFNTIKVDHEFEIPENLQCLTLRELGGFADFSKLKFPKTLKIIDLSDQKVGPIENFCFPPTLHSLNLERNDITSIRNTNIPEFSYLTSLYLGSNELRCSSSFNSQLPQSLKLLDLSSNQLQDCILLSCPKLHTLRLYNNKIGGILSKGKFNVPDSIVVLDLSRNKIEGFDKRFKFPSQLRDLSVLGNNIQVLNSTFFDNLPENLVHLNLNYNNISIQSSERVSLKRIKTLSLRDNNIDFTTVEKLPSQNGGLKKLDVGNK